MKPRADLQDAGHLGLPLLFEQRFDLRARQAQRDQRIAERLGGEQLPERHRAAAIAADTGAHPARIGEGDDGAPFFGRRGGGKLGVGDDVAKSDSPARLGSRDRSP